MIGVPTDVSLLDSVERLRDATLERFGAVHLVCNNAGIPSGSDGALWQHHVNDWRWAVDVNVFGVINGINTFVPVLLEQGGPGHVMNTSSSNGTFAPLSNSAVYATTKAAVTTITECLWGQLRSADSPIQVSLLLPSTRTPGALEHRHLASGPQPARALRAPGAGAGRRARRAHAVRRSSSNSTGRSWCSRRSRRSPTSRSTGILADQFWIYLPGEKSTETIDARAASMRDRHRARVPDRVVTLERAQGDVVEPCPEDGTAQRNRPIEGVDLWTRTTHGSSSSRARTTSATWAGCPRATARPPAAACCTAATRSTTSNRPASNGSASSACARSSTCGRAPSSSTPGADRSRTPTSPSCTHR